MGRRDAVQVTLEVIARMRALEPRLQVTWEPGWETRGNGTSANYEGGIVHHTATPSSLARPFPTQNLLRVGRRDLSGPLCNEAGPACTVDAPRIHVMAAHPANHAGASGGRSMGPLPVTSLFNPRVRALEIDYAGTVPMLAGQLYVAHLWARANADVVGGGDIQRIRAHFETSVTGKVDIGFAPGRSYDMPAFRRDAANYQEDDMLTAEEIAKAVWEYPIGDNGTDGNLPAWRTQGQTFEELKRPRQSAVTEDGKQSEARMTMGQYAVTADYYGYVTSKAVAGLRASQEELVRALAAVAKGDTLDVDALLARIDERIAAGIAAGFAEGVDVRVIVGDSPGV